MASPLAMSAQLVRDGLEHFDSYPCAARLGNGDLLVVFCRCDPATTATERTSAAIWGVRSGDSGATWSDAFPLMDTPGMLDYDPNLIAWDNKVMVISTTVPTTHSQKVTVSHFIAIRSDDYGHTWSEPFGIPFPYVYCSGKINPGLRLSDGTLVFGFCADIKRQRGDEVWGDEDSWGESGVMISRDDGRTWSPGQTIGLREHRPEHASAGAINGLDEPALAQCADGSLYMLMRSGFDRLFAARSMDQGRTWSPPRRSTLMSHNAPAAVCAFDHPDFGRGWLVIYDHSPHHRYPLAVAVSLDEGQTWSPPLILTGLGENASYPACVQTSEGPILLVWQRDFFVGDPSLPGPTPCGRTLEYRLMSLDEISHLAPLP